MTAKLKHNNFGFAHLFVILFVVVALIMAVGYRVFIHNKQESSISTQISQTASIPKAVNFDPVKIETKGDVKKIDQSLDNSLDKDLDPNQLNDDINAL